MIVLIFPLRRSFDCCNFHNNANARKLSIRILTASPRAQQLHTAIVLREHRDANDRQTKQK